MGRTNALRNKISSLQQLADALIPKARERMQEYASACPYHGMEDWLLIQNFYHGLVLLDRSHLDAAGGGGAFFLLSVADAKMLIEMMVSNQGWSNDRLQPCKQGMHSIKEVDMLAAKMDLLAKRVEHYEQMSAQETLKAIDFHMTCEVYGDVGHSGNSYVLRTRRTSTSSTPTMGFVHNNIKDGINTPTIKEVIIIIILPNV